ncbi:hypothetical protein J6590_008524 [Homalodisca vitripennis]|nr:hypothetical protein J6590_008524 [Homalodisca vitripennis]
MKECSRSKQSLLLANTGGDYKSDLVWGVQCACSLSLSTLRRFGDVRASAVRCNTHPPSSPPVPSLQHRHMMVTQQCSQGTDLHCWGRLMVIRLVLVLRGSVIDPKW